MESPKPQESNYKLKIGQTNIERFEGRLKIVIPSRKNPLVIISGLGSSLAVIFGAIFLVGIALVANIGPGTFGLLAFLLIWVGMGAINFVILAWNLAGEEVVIINSDELKTDKTILGLHFRKAFHSGEIREPRVVPRPGSLWYQEDYYFINAGRIACDYGMKTFRFGQGLEEAEAQQLINIINDSGYLRN